MIDIKNYQNNISDRGICFGAAPANAMVFASPQMAMPMPMSLRSTSKMRAFMPIIEPPKIRKLFPETWIWDNIKFVLNNYVKLCLSKLIVQYIHIWP